MPVINIQVPLFSISEDGNEVVVIQPIEEVQKIIDAPGSQDALTLAIIARDLLRKKSKIISLEKRLDRDTQFPSERADAEVSGG